MQRRQFFTSLAKVSADIMKNNSFYGSALDIPYTFIPCLLPDTPTLVTVNINLNTSLYSQHFNIIMLKKWPTSAQSFLTHVLKRHDLTDEVHALTWDIPQPVPSYLKKMVVVRRSALSTPKTAPKQPILLMQDNPTSGVATFPSVQAFAEGSDVYVGHINSLNNAQSPAFIRLTQFLS